MGYEMSKKKRLDPKTVPPRVGPYSPGLKIGDAIFVSGQLPIDKDTNEIVSEDVKKQAICALENIEYILAEADLKLRNVVKTTIYLTNMDDFNVVNQVYAIYFSPPYPARSCIQVSALPKGAKILVDCIAMDTRASDYEEDLEDDDCGGEWCLDE